MLGYRVCKNLIQYLRESIEGGKVAEYWICKRKRMIEQEYFQVDWEANKAAMKAVPVSRRHWVSKFESGMCGTGKMMKFGSRGWWIIVRDAMLSVKHLHIFCSVLVVVQMLLGISQ